MLKIDKAIILNKYGQELINSKIIIDYFSSLELTEKKTYLKEIVELIIQSKPKEKDVKTAIEKSGLKTTYTPCVLLIKGVTNHNLQRIVELPDSEMNKSLKLLLSLFKVSYWRRFNLEKNDVNKWWYWDLSKEENVVKALNEFG